MEPRNIREGAGKSFAGGMRLPGYKSFTDDVPIERLASATEVIIPLQQHVGVACEPTVEVGDVVEVGQKIGASDESVSAPVHASVDGVVTAIEPRPDYGGDEIESIVIQTELEATNSAPQHVQDPDELSVEVMRQAIRNAGVVGMGGSALPVHLDVGADQAIDTLILNGAECEPFLTCDHRLMLERPAELITGAELVMRCTGAEKTLIGIESDKLDAIEVLSDEIEGRDEFEVVPLAVKYPQGYKGLMITALTGRDVPRGARAAEVGCMVRNVATVVAIYEAVVRRKPLIERVVSVSGPEVGNPGNYLVRLGTPAEHVLREAGVDTEALRGSKVIFGDPMTGLAQTDLTCPVVKNTRGVLVLPSDMVREDVAYDDCVRCGACVERCPSWLYPNRLSVLGEYAHYHKLTDWGLWDCIECGICAYVCPADRPIVHFIKRAKRIIMDEL